MGKKWEMELMGNWAIKVVLKTMTNNNQSV
jgi:hypothetical protein